MDQLVRRAIVSVGVVAGWVSERIRRDIMGVCTDTFIFSYAEAMVERSLDFVWAGIVQLRAQGLSLVMPADAEGASATEATATRSSDAVMSEDVVIGGDRRGGDDEEREERGGRDRIIADAEDADDDEPAELAINRAAVGGIMKCRDVYKIFVGDLLAQLIRFQLQHSSTASSPRDRAVEEFIGVNPWEQAVVSLVRFTLRAVHGAEAEYARVYEQPIVLSDRHAVEALVASARAEVKAQIDGGIIPASAADFADRAVAMWRTF